MVHEPERPELFRPVCKLSIGVVMAIGFDQDEDEKFRQMLGGILGNGPAPYDVTTSMEQPEQQQLSAPYMPQSSAGGFSGYTPPPAAAPPQYLDHVQGHQFGGGDIAMLGGILAALLGGGKHRGEIAGSLAGQYGGAIMQNNARADQRNQQVDQFNSQLAAKDDPLERWKADMMGKQAVGNLDARGKELKLQQSREDRIAAAQAAEDAKDPVEQARLTEEARSKAILDRKRQENDMDVGTREMLGLILGKQKAQFAAPGGGSNDPAKELKRKQAEAALAGIDAGTVDPLTGKSKLPPEKPTTKRTPFADTEYEDGGEELFNEKNATAGNYQKNSDADAELTKGIAAMRKMKELVETHGSQWGSDEESARIKGESDTAKGVVQSSQAKLRALGVLQQKEQEKVDSAIGADIGPGMSDLTSRVGFGDLRVGCLEGAIKSFEDMQGISRHANGLRAKTKAPEKPLGESPSGIKFSVDTDAEKRFNAGEGAGAKPASGGTRTVTVTETNGTQHTVEASAADIEDLKRDKRVRSVQ